MGSARIACDAEPDEYETPLRSPTGGQKGGTQVESYMMNQGGRRRLATGVVLAVVIAIGSAFCVIRFYRSVRVLYLSWRLRPPEEPKAVVWIREVLSIRQEAGQLGVITERTLRSHIGLSVPRSPLPDSVPLPFRDGEDVDRDARTYVFAFPEARQILILRFAAGDHTLKSWEFRKWGYSVF